MANVSREFRSGAGRRVRRRSFLRGAAVGSVGTASLFMMGCGDDDGDADDGAQPTDRPANGTSTESPMETPSATTAGAAGTPKDGSYHSWIWGGSGRTIDLHREIFPTTSQPLSQAYSNLLVFDDTLTGTIRGDIAEGVPEQLDDLTYVFTLRGDVTWQNKPPANGRNLTMDDVKWNIERQRSRELTDGTVATDFARFTPVYGPIDNVEYTDDRTFTVRLKQPNGPWLSSMCDDFNGLMYRDIAERIENDPGNFSPDLVLGTGAYIFTEYSLNERVVAERNPDYFRKKSGEEVQFFDKIVGTALGTDVNAHRAALEQKQVDILGVQGQAVYKRAFIDAIKESSPDLIATDVPTPGAQFGLHFNYANGQVFGNERLRRAFDLAVDRQQVIQQQFSGEARLQPPVPWAYGDWAIPRAELAEQPGFRSDKTQDLKDARALWEAGGGPGLGDITLFVSEGPDGTAIAEWFRAMINDNLGISQFNVGFIAGVGILDYLRADDFEAFIVGAGAWSSPDPRARFAQHVVTDAGLNFGKYSRPDVDALVSEYLAELDHERAVELLRDVQRIALEDAGGQYMTMAAGFSKFLQWPYLQADGPYPWLVHKWVSERSWIDQEDPRISGRPSSF